MEHMSEEQNEADQHVLYKIINKCSDCFIKSNDLDYI